MTKLPDTYNSQQGSNSRRTAQELKMYFLEQSEELLKQYIDAATGKGELRSHNTAAREEVWNLLKEFILKSSDKLELEIEEAEDVIVAVARGKCTFEEGQKLLNLYKQVKDINQEDVGGSGEGGGPRFTINVLTADQASVEYKPTGTQAPLEISQEEIQNEEKD